MTYSGAWLNNQLNGYGFLTWPDGSKYEGNFKAGKRHGKGFKTYHNGETYDGNWIND